MHARWSSAGLKTFSLLLGLHKDARVSYLNFLSIHIPLPKYTITAPHRLKPLSKMQLSLHKLLTSSNLFTSVQQISLQPSSSHSEVNAISNSEVHENAEPHFGYQGPGVYHLLSLVDRYQLSLGNQGSGDGVSTVVWYVCHSLSLHCFSISISISISFT